MRPILLQEKPQSTITFQGRGGGATGVEVQVSPGQLVFLKHARTEWNQAQRILRQLLEKEEVTP